MQIIPAFLDHILIRLKALDGDNVLLHRQEHHVRDQLDEGKSWRECVHDLFCILHVILSSLILLAEF